MTDWLKVGWESNTKYALDLVNSVPEDRISEQPAPGMNHPAWVLSHLSLYHPAMVGLIRGATFTDPKQTPDAARYGDVSTPVADASQYLAKAALIERFSRGRKDVSAALQEMRPEILTTSVPLERWRVRWGTVGAALAYLMLVHESLHLGQISAWRRSMGLPRV